MTGILRFHIELNGGAQPKVTLLHGQNKGAWQILVKAAQTYLEARQYEWIEGASRKPCSYEAEVEYQILREQVPAPNNFFRVTTASESRTLVEVKTTTPTVNY